MPPTKRLVDISYTPSSVTHKYRQGFSKRYTNGTKETGGNKRSKRRKR